MVKASTFALVCSALAWFGVALLGCSVDGGVESEPTAARAQGLSCETNTGLYPMKAALAVALAKEVGRLDAVHDLEVAGGAVVLTSGALQRCADRGFPDCPNTSAILGMQQVEVNDYVPQNVFNATVYREDLQASFDRQHNHELDLAMNQPHRLPGEHTLWQQSITDNGACGIHYDFEASGDQIENLVERLVFFGGSSNPFLAFRQADSVVSIDPQATMNGDDSTSSQICYLGCYAYNRDLRDTCCSCSGKQGLYKVAPWDRSMLYCAY